MSAECDATKIAAGGSVTIRTTVTNTGAMAGGETVQVYVKAKDVKDAPNWQLKGLKKLNLAAGESAVAEITLNDKAFGLFDLHGEKKIYPGTYEIYVGPCQPDTRSMALTGKKPQVFTLRCDSEAVVETM